MPCGQIWPHLKFYLGLERENFRNLPVPSHKALSSGLSVRGVNYSPKVELIAKDNKFYMGLFNEIFWKLFVRTHGFQF